MQVGKEGPDAGGWALGHLLHSALRQDGAAVFTGTGAHLNEPVGIPQDLGVVIHQHDGVAVRDQVVHHAPQALDVGGVQADGGSSST
mgnify:FL=1